MVTPADLDGAETIAEPHVSEPIHCRNVDRQLF
jgi:hypothetical protein